MQLIIMSISTIILYFLSSQKILVNPDILENSRAGSSAVHNMFCNFWVIWVVPDVPSRCKGMFWSDFVKFCKISMEAVSEWLIVKDGLAEFFVSLCNKKGLSGGILLIYTSWAPLFLFIPYLWLFRNSAQYLLWKFLLPSVTEICLEMKLSFSC